MHSYPQDSIQFLANAWWQPSETETIQRGSLVWAYIPFFSQIPVEIVSDRAQPEIHETAHLQARPLYANDRRPTMSSLPVAGLPRLEGADCYLAFRAKKRPCLVVGSVQKDQLPESITRGMTKSHGHAFTLITPYYSVEQKGRAGYTMEAAERIRHAGLNSLFWDILPFGDGHESILRLDQTQPLGLHHQVCEPAKFALSPEALEIVDQWLGWMLHESPPKIITDFRDLVI